MIVSTTSIFAIAILAVVCRAAVDPSAGGAGAPSETVGAGSSSEDAKILASKFLLSRYGVENKEFVVDYHLYNIGDKAAIKVKLDDAANFNPQYFEIVKGVLTAQWERIPPGSNVSHSVIVKPLFYGSINYTSAEISYYPSETASSPRKGYTSAPGESYVYRQRDYERKFASRYMDWAIFALISCPSLLLPALLWYRSKKNTRN